MTRRVAFWRPFARLGAFACPLYLGVLLVLVALEDRLLFPGATFARPPREPPEHLGVRELTLTAEGERIHAWFSAPEGWTPSRGAVLFSHGNGSDLTWTCHRAFRWRDPFGRAVMLYDYPGYGRS